MTNPATPPLTAEEIAEARVFADNWDEATLREYVPRLLATVRATHGLDERALQALRAVHAIYEEESAGGWTPKGWNRFVTATLDWHLAHAAATLDRDRAARDALSVEALADWPEFLRLLDVLLVGVEDEYGRPDPDGLDLSPRDPEYDADDLMRDTAFELRQCLAALAASPSRALDIPPGCVCFVGPLVAASCPVHHPEAASPSPEPRIDGHDVEHAGEQRYPDGADDWAPEGAFPSSEFYEPGGER